MYLYKSKFRSGDLSLEEKSFGKLVAKASNRISSHSVYSRGALSYTEFSSKRSPVRRGVI